MRTASVMGSVLLACFALARPCAAQSEAKSAVAEALYRQARDLMAEGKLDQACPKFAESQRLDPATGTLLNLAACHERQGKLATAWLEFSDGLAAARRDGRQDRVDFAAERIAELEPRLSHLVLQLAPGAEVPELTLQLDGATFGRAALGAPTPVDPGSHSVRASAPGKKPWEQTVEIGAEADRQTLVIPALEDAPAERPSAPPPPAPPAPPAPAPPTLPPRDPERSDELAIRPVPLSVYLGAGITAALAVGAGVSGLVYLHERTDYQDALPRGASDELTRQRQSSKRMGYLNLGLWAATACAAGVTTALYVTRPQRAVATRIVPVLDPELAGLSVTGGF